MQGRGDTSSDLARIASALDPVPTGAARRRAIAAVKRGLLGQHIRPESLGRYALGPLLGSGAMGLVYRARDPRLDRDVALKVLRAPPPGESLGTARSRLSQEGMALARLSHPNVVEVFDVGFTHDEFFVAMELVDGLDASEWLATRSPERRAIIDVFIAAGEGLWAAHRAGVVHRDFKPANVLVTQRGQAKVTDFGWARILGTATSEDPAMDDMGSTTVGGTPAYVAPEQARGQGSPASDQFSYCVALYEALFGTQPFTLDSWDNRRDQIERGQIDFPADAPRDLRRILERGLRYQPELRWPSMAALLQRLVRTRRGRARRWTNVTALAGAIAVVGVVGVVGVAGPPPPAHSVASVGDEVRNSGSEEALEAALSSARALRKSGRYAEALALADGVRQEANAADHVRTEAAARLEVGRIRSHLLHTAAAREELETAYVLSVGAGDETTAMRSAIELVYLCGYGDGDAAATKRWSRAARALLQRNPSPPAQADLLENEAAVASKQGRFGEAIDKGQRALELRGPDHDPQRSVRGLGNLASFHAGAGDLPRARELIAEAIESASEGGSRTDLARLLMMQSIFARRMGDLTAARSGLHRALDISRLSPETRVSLEIPILINLGGLSMQDDDKGRALAYFLDAQRRLGEVEHAPAMVRLALLKNLGWAFAEAGDLKRASEAFRDALTLAEGFHDAPHPELAAVRVDLGQVLAAQGNRELARDYYEEALSGVAGTELSLTEPYAGDVIVAAAGLLRLGDAQRARDLLEPIFEAQQEPPLPPNQAGKLMVILAHARRASGEGREDACVMWRHGAEALRAVKSRVPRLAPVLDCEG